MAQIAGPLAAADISAYYISTFNFDHALVRTWAGVEVPASTLKSQWWGKGDATAGLGSRSSLARVSLAFHAAHSLQVPEDEISCVIDILQRRQEGLASKAP